jgi:hypothetical protein
MKCRRVEKSSFRDISPYEYHDVRSASNDFQNERLLQERCFIQMTLQVSAIYPMGEFCCFLGPSTHTSDGYVVICYKLFSICRLLFVICYLFPTPVRYIKEIDSLVDLSLIHRFPVS